VRIEDHTAMQQERDVLNTRLLGVQVGVIFMLPTHPFYRSSCNHCKFCVLHYGQRLCAYSSVDYKRRGAHSFLITPVTSRWSRILRVCMRVCVCMCVCACTVTKCSCCPLFAPQDELDRRVTHIKELKKEVRD
jgi:hypothetical protein